MQAGKFDRRVVLLRRAAGTDNGFEVVPGNWAELGSRLASVRPERRGEETEGAGLVARRVCSFWLRWDSLSRTLTATDAIQFDGRIYELTAEPEEIGRREGVAMVGVAGAVIAAPAEGWSFDFGDEDLSALLVLLEDI